MKKTICESFPITNSEYFNLETEFGKLIKYEAWQLIKKNAKNNHTDDFDDINQELLMSIIRAGSYYKRQIYIESCIIKSVEHVGGVKAIELLHYIISISKPDDYLKHEAKAALKRMPTKPEIANAANEFLIFVLQELVNLWHNRTRHGANRQKFGNFQERLLERIVRQVVPKELRPAKKQPLKIDTKFATYCKAITWNAQKSMGRKITREKSIRTGQVSLSEYDYLQSGV